MLTKYIIYKPCRKKRKVGGFPSTFFYIQF
nr:MAG TPA: hypothetical protein [Caudoviricetes sp.]